MVTDHAAIAIVSYYLVRNSQRLSFEAYKEIYSVYEVMRGIGRAAFPIYCFLLTEGFIYTKNFFRYALRLFVFSLISEPFFDLAIYDRLYYPDYQNVYFTLLISILCLHLLKSLRERPGELFGFIRGFKGGALFKLLVSPVFIYICFGAAIGGSMAAAHYLKTDYSYKGVLVIVLMYLLRGKGLPGTAAGELPLYYEPLAFFSLIPISLYNKKRGRIGGNIGRYFFYAFYPAHLFVLYLISYFCGLRG